MRRMPAIAAAVVLWGYVGASDYRLPAHVKGVEWHVRVERDGAATGGEGPAWEIRWGTDDTANYRYAAVVTDGGSGGDATYGVMTAVHVGRAREGRREEETVHKFFGKMKRDDHGAGFSLVLTAHGEEASLEAGGRRAELSVGAGGADSLRVLSCRVGRGGRIVVDRLCYDTVASPVERDFDWTVGRAEGSADVSEGVWTYFDRNTDPLLSRPGGEYRLVTVRDTVEEVYEIVYAGGATELADEWTAGRVKGVMRPTGATGVFDLTWYQPDGSLTGEGCSATVDGDFLVLEFPRWKATVRFVRDTNHRK